MGVLLLPKVGIEINQAMKIDGYLLEKDTVINPDENYIISRDKQGNVVSYYKDDIWDFKYYKSNSKSSEKIFFEKIHTKEIRKEAKRLIFIIMAFKKGKGSSAISTNTLIGLYYNSMIAPISIYSIKENIFMKEFFEDSNHILKYINNFCTNTNQIIILRSMLELLHSINNQLSGINFKKDDKLFDYLGQIIHTQRYKINQTEVIPIRILQNSIKQRWEQVDLLESNLNSLILFIENIINIEHYACSNSTYEKYKNSVDGIIKWNEAISDCGLKELFETYNIQNKRLFRSFIKKIQGTVKHLIHAYSGMRDQEVISLKNNCYKEELVDDTNIVRIIGITTKLEGRHKLTNWITSSIIFKAINILREINRAILKNIECEYNTQYLFLSPKMINYENHKIKNNYQFQTHDQLPLNQNEILIDREDLTQLKNINYLKDYDSSSHFQLGSVWNFYFHQYRRTLAVYSIQSGLVSLGSLQWQLKHLFKEMTLYYANGASRAKKIFDLEDDHIALEMNQIKPEIDAISYIENVLLSNEKLYGAHGKFIESIRDENKIFFKKDRAKIIQKFKNGELAFKETALGACVTIEPCNESLLGSITACIDCAFAVHKISKIEKLIDEQNYLINVLDKNSVEYRTEKLELEKLKTFLKTVSKD